MLVETKNVVKQYNSRFALNNINVSIPVNSIYGLLGPNGAGKTTLIRIINRITQPDSGEIFFDGERLQSKHIGQIGYLPEERGLYKKMKVGEQAIYLARLKGLSKEDAGKRCKYWFEKFGIETWWNRAVEELSKGMQQKVQFIITVLHEPKLLIFDEPFSGFDPLNADMLKKEILELKENGATIIFSAHDMLSVEELCDNISLINKAEVVLEGAVPEIRERFKQHVFTLRTYDTNVEIPENDLFYVIISSKKQNGIQEIKLKSKKANTQPNELILHLMRYCSILSFEEELPSLNDVFIKTVKENN